MISPRTIAASMSEYPSRSIFCSSSQSSARSLSPSILALITRPTARSRMRGELATESGEPSMSSGCRIGMSRPFHASALRASSSAETSASFMTPATASTAGTTVCTRPSKISRRTIGKASSSTNGPSASRASSFVRSFGRTLPAIPSVAIVMVSGGCRVVLRLHAFQHQIDGDLKRPRAGRPFYWPQGEVEHRALLVCFHRPGAGHLEHQRAAVLVEDEVIRHPASADLARDSHRELGRRALALVAQRERPEDPGPGSGDCPGTVLPHQPVQPLADDADAIVARVPLDEPLP